MRHSKITRPTITLVALLALWVIPACLSAATLTGLQSGNVTPSSVTLLWQVEGEGEPALDIYADAGFSQAPAGDPVVEFYPLHTGDPDRPGSGEVDYQRRTELTAAIAGEGLVIARVTGLLPDTVYFLRPDVVDGSGVSTLVSTPISTSVTTAEFTDFVVEARQLILDLGGAPGGPSQHDGTVARLELPGSPYPLFAVVGDALGSGVAYFDLSHLLGALGQTNAVLLGNEAVELSLLNAGFGTQTENIAFDGTFVVANAVTVPFNFDGEALAAFVFDTITTQQRNVAFPVTIRAVDAQGDLLTSFNGTVIIGSNTGLLSRGAGQTVAFTDGVLSGQEVALDDTGTHSLSAENIDGSVTGQSNAFEVNELLRSLLVEADPAEGGNVTGSGDIPNGTLAAITATPSADYYFEKWVGEGVANSSSSSTTVDMVDNRVVTAIFKRLLTASYDTWAQGKFLRNVGNLNISGKLADPENDGLVNLLEFAFGTDPTRSGGSEALPKIDRIDGDSVTLSFHRIRNSKNVIYQVMASPEVGGGYVEIIVDPVDVTTEAIDQDYEKVEIQLDRIGDQRFFRVTVDIDDGT